MQSAPRIPPPSRPGPATRPSARGACAQPSGRPSQSRSTGVGGGHRRVRVASLGGDCGQTQAQGGGRGRLPRQRAEPPVARGRSGGPRVYAFHPFAGCFNTFKTRGEHAGSRGEAGRRLAPRGAPAPATPHCPERRAAGAAPPRAGLPRVS